jgi:hypothetical protein
MKIRLPSDLVGLAISFALPTFAQQKETVDPQVIEQLKAQIGKKYDEAGGTGVYIFTFTPAGNTAVATVHHHWVTAAGETINLADATAKAYQVGSFPGIYAVGGGSYTATITGGTGRFANATGTLSFSGALDEGQGTVVLRYRGTICLNQQNPTVAPNRADRKERRAGEAALNRKYENDHHSS